MKKIFLVFSIISMMLVGFANAEEFYVKNYKRSLTVSETNNVHVKEFISAYFFRKAHGFYREIPIISDIPRTDGTTFVNHGRISNIITSENNQIETIGKIKRIKVGSPDVLIAGDHTYALLYTYQMEKTNLKDKDEFYFNIVGANWTTQINNFSFQIVMPKEFDPENISFIVGNRSEEESAKLIHWTVDGKTISGAALKTLEPHEAIVIRIELPKGYFRDGMIIEKSITTCTSIVLALIALIMWFLFAKNQKVIPLVNFRPPKKLNSAEVGAIYSEGASAKDIVSLIYYLANKGYIEIINNGRDIIFKKLKTNEGAKKIEAMMLNAMFRKKNMVTKRELESLGLFNEDANELIAKLDEMLEPIYKKSSLHFGIKMIPALTTIGITIMLYYTMVDFSLNALLYTCQNVIIAAPFIVIPIFIYSSSRSSHSPFVIFFNSLIYFGFMLFFVSLFIPRDFINSVIANRTEAIVSACCLVISMICLYQMPKKSAAGLKYLGLILGFKKFLETAEENKIKALIKKMPKYCYNVMPYAYVLGIGQDWIQKSERIITQPKWINGEFNSDVFKDISESLEKTITHGDDETKNQKESAPTEENKN